VRLSPLLAGGAVVAVLAGTAACGTQALEPRIALRDAASAFSASRSGAVELSIASSADDVRAFAEAAEPAGAEVADEDLEQMLSASLEVAYDLGADREDQADDASSVLVHVGDLVAGEVRSVEEIVYGRVDVDGLVAAFPEMQQGVDEFRAGLAGADGMEPAPAELQAPANALLDGDWVSLDMQAYLDQLEEMTGGEEAGAGMSDLYASDEMRDLLGAAVTDAVTSVERRESDQIGDHLVATIDLRKAYTTLRSELPGLLEGADAEMMAESLPPVDEVPDKQIDVSFWLRDGELKRAELDLAQFLEQPAGSLVLRADVLPAREISAPDDAVEFDFASLMAHGAAGEVQYEEAMAPDAYTVAAWIDMDIFAIASEDGGQPSVQYLPEVLPYYDGTAPDLVITAVGERVQVGLGGETVCLTVSPDGYSEDIADGPC
jgi:hypothetical protein